MTSEAFLWHELTGMVGAISILGAYFLLQTERISSDSLAYSMANFIGALLILLSLIYRFNLPAFIIESVWVLISGFGLLKYVAQHFGRNKAGEQKKNISEDITS